MNGILERSLVALEPMINRLVFVGRQVTGLLVTHRAALALRPTFSVDAVVIALSYSALDRLMADLARLGLRQEGDRTSRSGRWMAGEGVIVELIASDAHPSGIRGQWHEYALECTLAVPLGTRTVRVAGAPAFLALKLAAFAERGLRAGAPDVDLEDVLAVVNGRSNLEREVAAAPAEVRRFIRDQLAALVSRTDADSVLDAHIPDAARFPQLAVASLERLRRLAVP
jgi:hypothetical protein